MIQAKVLVTVGVIVLLGAAAMNGWQAATARAPVEQAKDQPFDHRAPLFGLKVVRYALDEMDLTPEQRGSIREVFEEARPEIRGLMERARGSRERLISATPDDPDYYLIVEEVSRDGGELATEAIRLGSEVRARVYSHLTEEQRARLPQVREKVRSMAWSRAWEFAMDGMED